MLQNFAKKIKSGGGFDHEIGRIALEALVLGAFLVTSFLLGRASIGTSGGTTAPIIVVTPENQDYGTYYKQYRPSSSTKAPVAIKADTEAPKGLFGASVNGTKYYPKGCSGLSRIKAENMIWFTTEEEAVDAGYSRASNC